MDKLIIATWSHSVIFHYDNIILKLYFTAAKAVLCCVSCRDGLTQIFAVLLILLKHLVHGENHVLICRLYVKVFLWIYHLQRLEWGAKWQHRRLYKAGCCNVRRRTVVWGWLLGCLRSITLESTWTFEPRLCHLSVAKVTPLTILRTFYLRVWHYIWVYHCRRAWLSIEWRRLRDAVRLEIIRISRVGGDSFHKTETFRLLVQVRLCDNLPFRLRILMRVEWIKVE